MFVDDAVSVFFYGYKQSLKGEEGLVKLLENLEMGERTSRLVL